MTSTIDILYTIGKSFSLWLGIRDRYLRIRLWLSRINCQNFVILHEKMCWWFGYFRHERRIPFWRASCAEHNDTKDHSKKWPLTGVWVLSPPWPITLLHLLKRWSFTAKWTNPGSFSVFWSPSSGACPSTMSR